jgi:hypothetical protein
MLEIAKEYLQHTLGATSIDGQSLVVTSSVESRCLRRLHDLCLVWCQPRSSSPNRKSR